jgi:hypothetical protein
LDNAITCRVGHGDWNEETTSRGCAGSPWSGIRVRSGHRATLHQGACDGPGIQLDGLLRRRQCCGQWGSADPTTSTIYDPVAGYSARTSVATINALGAQRANSSGVTGGFTAGYNWQAGSVVLGLEGDFNYLGFKGSAVGSGAYPCCAPPNSFTVASSVSADRLATIRGPLRLPRPPELVALRHRRRRDRRCER